MAYNLYGNNQIPYQNRQGQRTNNNRTETPPQEIHAQTLPEDYVDMAEKLMANSQWNRKITTSKIRRLFSLLIDIYQEENRRTEEKLKPESEGRIRLVRVRMLYEAGRDDSVKLFLQESKLVHYLKGIETRLDFINYFHYMEALVAYHKYFGGKE